MFFFHSIFEFRIETRKLSLGKKNRQEGSPTPIIFTKHIKPCLYLDLSYLFHFFKILSTTIIIQK